MCGERAGGTKLALSASSFMPINQNVVETTCKVVCREIYSLVDGPVGVWAAVSDVQKRLNVTKAEAQEALHYALGRGWIEGVAIPMFFVMLSPAGSRFVFRPSNGG